MRVLLVEDNRDIAENVFEYLEPKGHVVDYAADGQAGLRLALQENFDVIVLDVMLPGIDGITLCRRLRNEADFRMPILMLTAKDRIEDKLQGFDAGADDYLVKPFSLQELEARIIALHRRNSQAGTTRRLTVADVSYDADTLQVWRNDTEIKLSATCRRILVLLMRNSHRVVTRTELEHEIWGDHAPDGDVLRAHIYALRTAIDRPFATKLIQTIHGEGYRLVAHDG